MLASYGELLFAKVPREQKPHGAPRWPTRELGGRQEQHPSRHLTQHQPPTPAQSASEIATLELDFTATLEDAPPILKIIQRYTIVSRDERMPTMSYCFPIFCISLSPELALFFMLRSTFLLTLLFHGVLWKDVVKIMCLTCMP